MNRPSYFAHIFLLFTLFASSCATKGLKKLDPKTREQYFALQLKLMKSTKDDTIVLEHINEVLQANGCYLFQLLLEKPVRKICEFFDEFMLKYEKKYPNDDWIYDTEEIVEIFWSFYQFTNKQKHATDQFLKLLHEILENNMGYGDTEKILFILLQGKAFLFKILTSLESRDVPWFIGEFKKKTEEVAPDLDILDDNMSVMEKLSRSLYKFIDDHTQRLLPSILKAAIQKEDRTREREITRVVDTYLEKIGLEKCLSLLPKLVQEFDSNTKGLLSNSVKGIICSKLLEHKTVHQALLWYQIANSLCGDEQYHLVPYSELDSLLAVQGGKKKHTIKPSFPTNDVAFIISSPDGMDLFMRFWLGPKKNLYKISFELNAKGLLDITFKNTGRVFARDLFDIYVHFFITLHRFYQSEINLTTSFQNNLLYKLCELKGSKAKPLSECHFFKRPILQHLFSIGALDLTSLTKNESNMQIWKERLTKQDSKYIYTLYETRDEYNIDKEIVDAFVGQETRSCQLYCPTGVIGIIALFFCVGTTKQ